MTEDIFTKNKIKHIRLHCESCLETIERSLGNHLYNLRHGNTRIICRKCITKNTNWFAGKKKMRDYLRD